MAGRNIETAMSSPFAGNYGAEMIIEFEIEEGSIHVQQDGILRPVDTFHRST